MISTLDISKTFQFNPGGVKELNMSILEDISVMPLPIFNVIEKGIRMKPGKLFKRFYFSDFCKFSESFIKTVHGREYTSTVSFPFRSVTPEIIFQLEEMKRMKFIAIPRDNNDKYRVIGSIDSPAKFNYEFSTGPGYTNSDECICSFSAKSNRSALYYGSNFNNVIYNEGYNLGFLKTR